MSSNGTVGLAWMLSRYCSLDRRMSVVFFSATEPTIDRGRSGVRGAAISIRPPGIPTRRPMSSRTGELAITLPRRIARSRRLTKLLVPVLRSSIAEPGVSTTTCVLAVAIVIVRGWIESGES